MTTSFFSLPARAAGRYPQVNARSVQPGSGKGRRCAPPYQAAPWRVRSSPPCLHCTPGVLACKGSLNAVILVQPAVVSVQPDITTAIRNDIAARMQSPAGEVK
ncbi:hypothetical protein BFG07_14380 [Kosakonia cowanii]|nr:hypothetical protein BFG07_14380 [Kosakonia cowanii]